jgi:predicted nucleic acid-binding protein
MGWACDTSVALAALDPQHEAHTLCRRVLVDRRPALAGHAVFETHSVLTRLPPPLRLTAAQAEQVLRAAFRSCWLDPAESSRLRSELGSLGIVGGSVYDALVGRAAAVHDRVLLTRDRRAERTYRVVGVAYEVVG